MRKKINYGKLVAVIFLTVLIWVWADLRLDEEFSVTSATISVAKSTNPNLWVSFDDESSVSIEQIVLKGSASRVADIRRKLNAGLLVFNFFLEPGQESMTAAGEHVLNLLNFLKANDKIRELGLTVQSCKPETLNVRVVELVKRTLDVQCLDEDQNPVKTATIEPRQVEMFVPASWEGELLKATVSLARGEIDQAQTSVITKTPQIELVAGQVRNAPQAVKITVSPEEDQLRAGVIKNVTVGFIFSANLQGKYGVEVTNLGEVMGAVAIRATPAAKRAYENMRYQVLLEIDDSDKDADPAEPLRKELIYNFPAEFVRTDEIILKQSPVMARFKLTPLALAQE